MNEILSERYEIQPIGKVEEEGETSKVRIYPKFTKALQGIEGFSHVIILYWFHLRDNKKDRNTLKVIPKRHPGAPEVGVFACRSPARPNPIGLCVTQLLEVEDNVLIVKGLDALKDSPIIDIKPYSPRADMIANTKVPDWALQGPIT